MGLRVSVVDCLHDVLSMSGIAESDATATKASPAEAGPVDSGTGVQDFVEGDQMLAATLIVIDGTGPRGPDQLSQSVQISLAPGNGSLLHPLHLGEKVGGPFAQFLRQAWAIGLVDLRRHQPQGEVVVS
jgi:hypothetical protein